MENEHYLDFVRGHACAWCLAPGPSDAHHFMGPRGTGIKASDYFTVPLCRAHHEEWHRKARTIAKATRDETELILLRTAMKLLVRYTESR